MLLEGDKLLDTVHRSVITNRAIVEAVWPGSTLPSPLPTIRIRSALREFAREFDGSLGLMHVARNGCEFDVMFSRLIGPWVREGLLKRKLVKLVDGGLTSVEKALMETIEYRASGMKCVVSVDEIEELKRPW